MTVLAEFEERNIRYVLVGGLAVLLHGVDRLTADGGAKTMANGVRYVGLELLGSTKSTPDGRFVRAISHGLRNRLTELSVKKK